MQSSTGVYVMVANPLLFRFIRIGDTRLSSKSRFRFVTLTLSQSKLNHTLAEFLKNKNVGIADISILELSSSSSSTFTWTFLNFYDGLFR